MNTDMLLLTDPVSQDINISTAQTRCEYQIYLLSQSKHIFSYLCSSFSLDEPCLSFLQLKGVAIKLTQNILSSLNQIINICVSTQMNRGYYGGRNQHFDDLI